MDLELKTLPDFNVQRQCEKIHAQYGITEMANYHIQQMCDRIADKAFAAGKQSVIDNIPELTWHKVWNEIWYTYYSSTPLGHYNIDPYGDCWITLFGRVPLLGGRCKTVDECKEVAQRHYKQTIIEALNYKY